MTSAETLIPVPDAIARSAGIDAERYRAMYERSLQDPENFWREQLDILDWAIQPTKIRNATFRHPDVSIRWFEDGALNVAHNCIDRHLPSRGDQAALIWERDEPGQSRHVSYRELHREVCRMANSLKALGIGKGDRVVLYMPMIPAAAYAMLACARIGAVHSVVFGGFSAEALADRIVDSGARLVITANQSLRGGRRFPLKKNCDKARALAGLDNVQTLVMRCTDAEVAMQPGIDHDYDALAATLGDDCPAEPMNAEDPLFILYTSGSTGKPKGVLHTTGGYLLYAALTHRHVFDYRDGDVYWCTADVGWVTGHSYIVYGPLANGATSLIFEGVPTYPTPSRFWEVCETHKVNLFYTAPTALRALMGLGNEHVARHDLSALRVLGSVGEPINPEAWRWYHEVVGGGRCPIVDTWWQTETGGIMIAPLPGATALKPGSATLPFFGVEPALLDADGKEVIGAGEGSLVIKGSWPGQMRTVFGDHERFVQTYFETFKGSYFTGDGARRDADGYYWITGRVDDVMNVSGHRLGSAEIESALVAHRAVSEAAVVGYPHPIKGQGIYCYVTLMAGLEGDEALRSELVKWVRSEIGPIASPDRIQFAPSLPKTRSGKIMRRILRKIAENDFGSLGDISTLAEPAVVDDLIENRRAG